MASAKVGIPSDQFPMADQDTQEGFSTNTATTPKALLVWNNESRLSLPLLPMAWLAILVTVSLASTFFVHKHAAARWVLGGFVVSHLIVFTLPVLTTFTVRRGFVSLLHVVCWTPGVIATIADFQGREESTAYAVWSYGLIAVTSISFLFDMRDACTYLYYVARMRPLP